LFALLTAISALLGVLALTAPARGAEPSDGLLTSLSTEQQVQMAMSAAPAEIARDATVWALTPTGYVQVRAGSNGFNCLVERQLLETIEPSCYDAEGSATTLPTRLYREELRIAKIPEEELEKRIEEGYRAGRFVAPRKPGLVYMLSSHNKVLNDRTGNVIRVPPHVMFYAPYAAAKDFGGFISPHLPYVVLEGRPDAYIIMNVAPAAARSHGQQDSK
jgi:hypothetical protein